MNAQGNASVARRGERNDRVGDCGHVMHHTSKNS